MTFSFPRIWIIIGTPTPGCSPANANRRICMTTFDCKANPFPTCSRASDIDSTVQSVRVCNRFVVANRTLSSAHQLVSWGEHTYQFSWMPFAKLSCFRGGIIRFREKVWTGFINILKGMHPLLRHSDHSLKVFSFRHLPACQWMIHDVYTLDSNAPPKTA